MKRAVRWVLLSVGLAGVVTAVTVVPSGHTAVRADEHPFGAWHRHVTWDHPAAVRNGCSHGADHG